MNFIVERVSSFYISLNRHREQLAHFPGQGVGLMLIRCLAMSLLPFQVMDAQTVNIPDSNLRAALEDALGKPSGELITEDEMASFTYLNLKSQDIEDLTGLEAAVNLTRLYLSENRIANLAPLGDLINLVELDLNQNQIVDISPIEKLINLQYLLLFQNEINNLEHFPALSAPRDIWLSYNNITEVAPLLDMVNVSRLELQIHHNLLDISDGSDDRAVLDELILQGAEIMYGPQKEVELRYYPDPLYISAYAGETLSAEIVISSRGDLELEYSLSTTDSWISIGKSEGTLPPWEDHEIPVETITLTLGPIPDFTESITGTILIQSNDLENPSVELPVIVSHPVDIPDANLRTELEDRLYREPGEPISTAEMATLTYITLANREVTTLEGLQTAVNLEQLSFLSNNLSDLSPLSGLTNLRDIGVVNNLIQDVSALGALTNLENLNLNNNKISDVSALLALTKLETLNLENNQISDVSALAGLTGLQSLRLSYNEIQDISPLRSLSTMVNRPIIIEYNHLDISDGSEARAVIDELHEAGVWVYYSPQSVPNLLTWIPKFKFAGIVGATYSTVITLGNEGANDLTFTINPDVPWLKAEPGSGVIPYQGRMNIEVTIGPVPEYEDSLTGSLVLSTNALYSLEEHITYSLTPVADIPDSTLHGILLDELEKNPGDLIAEAELEDLTRLSIYNRAVEELTGLELAINLDFLIVDASVEDLSALAGLSHLTQLHIRGNPLSDLTPLESLFGLEELSLGGNQIVDISPLAGLTGLKSLSLSENPLSDISLLPVFTSLESLFLRGCPVSDFTPLTSLTGLTKLYLGGCQLTDLDFLGSLTALSELNLQDNSISDLSPLSGLVNLHNLTLGANQISDLSPLSGLHELEFLDLWENQISDLTPLSSLTNLETLDLDNNRIIELGPLSGLAQLERLSLDWNYLHIEQGSPAFEIILSLKQAGVGVSHDHQMQPILEVFPTILELVGASGETITGQFEVHNSGNRDLEFQMAGADSWISFDSTPVIIGPHESGIVTLTMGPIPACTDNLVGEVSAVTNDPYFSSVNIPYDVFPAGHIPDAGLLEAIRNALGLPPDTPVSAGQLATLTNLSYESGTVNLSGLEAAVNLEGFRFSGNNIESLFPIARLENLKQLDLVDIRNTYLEPLASLPGLTNLSIKNTWVKDISVISNFEDLVYLGLFENSIVDISALENLTKLERLFIRDNKVEDISSLQHLTNLTLLELSDNKISDLTPLAGLTRLKNLMLGSNEITDISALQELTELTHLSLSRNTIVDISAMRNMRLLDNITIGYNQIADLTPLAGLTGVNRFQVGNNNVYLGPGSASREVIDYYIAQGVPYIVYLPQNTPWLQLSSEMIHVLATEGETVRVGLILTNGCNRDLEFTIRDSESWITSDPGEGTIPRGDSVEVSVTLSDIPPIGDSLTRLLILSTDDPDYPQRNVTLQVLPEKQSFESWAVKLALPIDSREPSDRNGSLNIQNILAYAMGIDPMAATSDQLPSIGFSPETDTLRMEYSFNDRAIGIERFFEASSDLESWTTVSPSESQILSDDGQGHLRQAAVFTNGSAYPFVRLSVREAEEN